MPNIPGDDRTTAANWNRANQPTPVKPQANEVDTPASKDRSSVDITAAISMGEFPEAKSAEDLASRITKFGQNVMGQMTGTNYNDNLTISPFSVHTAVSLAATGAEDDTLSEMQRTLGLAGTDIQKTKELYKQLLVDIQSDSSFKLANGIWFKPGKQFNTGFIDDAHNFFGSEVREMTSADEINNWVAEKTEGKIDHMVDQINPNDVARLFNAVYFKGDWKEEFSTQETVQAPFTKFDNTQVDVAMMSKKFKQVPYYEKSLSGGKAQIIRLPYASGKFSAIVAVPENNSALNALMHNSDWSELIKDSYRANGEEVKLRLPKFKTNSSASLKSVLTKLGIQDAFNARAANFSAMDPSNNTMIEDVDHKACIDVNEQGTEATAATQVVMTTRGMAPRVTQVDADKPFLFMLVHNNTQTPVFTSLVSEPTKFSETSSDDVKPASQVALSSPIQMKVSELIPREKSEAVTTGALVTQGGFSLNGFQNQAYKQVASAGTSPLGGLAAQLPLTLVADYTDPESPANQLNVEMQGFTRYKIDGIAQSAHDEASLKVTGAGLPPQYGSNVQRVDGEAGKLTVTHFDQDDGQVYRAHVINNGQVLNIFDNQPIRLSGIEYTVLNQALEKQASGLKLENRHAKPTITYNGMPIFRYDPSNSNKVTICKCTGDSDGGIKFNDTDGREVKINSTGDLVSLQ